MTTDPTSFRRALGSFATGVTVVTTLSPDGQPVGLTVNSFTSVSLEPPLVLFCIGRDSSVAAAFAEATGFGVNVLAEDQMALSTRFASTVEDRFFEISHRAGLGGVPLLDGCLATIECDTHARHDGGDHIILVGLVRGLFSRPGRPLLYFRGSYAAIG